MLGDTKWMALFCAEVGTQGLVHISKSLCRYILQLNS